MKNIRGVIQPFFKYNMTSEEIDYLRELDEEYGWLFIAKRAYIEHQFPTNVDEEFDTFIKERNKGKKYFPVLKYKVNESKVIEIVERFNSLRTRFEMFDCYLSKFYIEIIDKLILTTKISLEPRTYYQEYNNKYKNTPSKETLETAYNFLGEYPYKNIKEGRDIGAKEALEFCKKHMKKLGFDYEVRIKKNQIPRMSVRADVKKLYISDKAKFSQTDLDGLLAHEIKGHVARRFYGEKRGLNLFRFGLLNHSIYDEGIAVWNSLNLINKPKPNIYANISLNAIVAAKCEEMDFCELFEHLKEVAPDLSDRHAFNNIIRVKRLFKYCELMGGDCEDAASYLEGYLIINEGMKKDKKFANRLTLNNIGLNQMEYLGEIEDFFKYNKIK